MYLILTFMNGDKKIEQYSLFGFGKFIRSAYWINFSTLKNQCFLTFFAYSILKTGVYPYGFVALILFKGILCLQTQARGGRKIQPY